MWVSSNFNVLVSYVDGESEEADNWAAMCGLWTRGSD
jgi:hypothetical protein